MSDHMNRRFNKMKKEASTKFTSVGIIIRLILVLIFLLCGRWFCDTMTQESIQYYEQERY